MGKSAYINTCLFSTDDQSLLDSESKFQMLTLGNLSIDDELDDDDVSYPGKTGETVSLSARKLKVKQPFLKKTTKISVPAIINENFLPLCGFMAFRDVRNFLLISHADGIIDDEELIVLYDLYSSRDPDFPYDHYTTFDLDALDESESVAEFRLCKRDVRTLSNVLQIPDTIICDQRSICDGIEGLCILLKRMSCMLADSRLLDDLEQFAFNAAGQPLCVYGDPAYPLRIHLQQPFKYGVLTPQMEEYNHRMSAVRTSVEWLFGDVVNLKVNLMTLKEI